MQSQSVKKKNLKEKEGVSLDKVKYGVFGLGDSSYVYFNEAAKKIDECMNKLGAQRIIDTAYGDDLDLDKYDTQFEEWEPNLFNSLKCKKPENKLIDSKYCAKIITGNDASQIMVGEFVPGIDETAYPLPMKTNIRLTDPNYERDFRHYEFDITDRRELFQFDLGSFNMCLFFCIFYFFAFGVFIVLKT